VTVASFHNAYLPNRGVESVPAVFSKQTPGKNIYLYLAYDFFNK